MMALLKILSFLRVLSLKGTGAIDKRRGVYRVNDALSQFLNAFLFRGDPNECISGRCWREQRTWAIKLINKIFFLQENHCKEAWEKDNYWAMQRYAQLKAMKSESEGTP